MILPGAYIGVLGGGQLGSMFLNEARRMGYKIAVLDPDPNSPAGRIADKHIQAEYTDKKALAELSQLCAAITTEFENVPAETLHFLSAQIEVSPPPQAVAIAQDRILEKNFMCQNDLAVVPYAVIEKKQDIRLATEKITGKGILKLARFGYDGKGQILLSTVTEQSVYDAFVSLGEKPCVLEQQIVLDKEVSIVAACSKQGEIALYAIAENRHSDGILDYTQIPANVNIVIQQQIEEKATHLIRALQYHGVLAIEFFIDQEEQIYINEIAPRPHNSGHYTLDACVTSQFEQQIRTLCHLGLGDTTTLTPVVMVNLLGDLWHHSKAPDWQVLLAQGNVVLHLYGKEEARPGRKMGHFCCLGADPHLLISQAKDLKQKLVGVDNHQGGVTTI